MSRSRGNIKQPSIDLFVLDLLSHNKLEKFRNVDVIKNAIECIDHLASNNVQKILEKLI